MVAVVAALILMAAEPPALAVLALLAAFMPWMIASEAVRYVELREQIRHEDVGPEAQGVHERVDSP